MSDNYHLHGKDKELRDLGKKDLRINDPELHWDDSDLNRSRYSDPAIADDTDDRLREIDTIFRSDGIATFLLALNRKKNQLELKILPNEVQSLHHRTEPICRFSVMAKGRTGARILVAASLVGGDLDSTIRKVAFGLSIFETLEPDHVLIRYRQGESMAEGYSLKAPPGWSHPLSLLVTPSRQEDLAAFDRFWACTGGINASAFWYASSSFDFTPELMLDRELCKKENFAMPNFSVHSNLGEPRIANVLHGTAQDFCGFYPRGTVRVLEALPASLDRSVMPTVSGKECHFGKGFDGPDRDIDAALLTVAILHADGAAVEHRIVFVEAANSTFEKSVIDRGLFNPTWICTKTCGCGFGGNNRCEADLDLMERRLHSGAFAPQFWITDHIRHQRQQASWHAGKPEDSESGWGEWLTEKSFILRERGNFASPKVFEIVPSDFSDPQ